MYLTQRCCLTVNEMVFIKIYVCKFRVSVSQKLFFYQFRCFFAHFCRSHSKRFTFIWSICHWNLFVKCDFCRINLKLAIIVKQKEIVQRCSFFNLLKSELPLNLQHTHHVHCSFIHVSDFRLTFISILYSNVRDKENERWSTQ